MQLNLSPEQLLGIGGSVMAAVLLVVVRYGVKKLRETTVSEENKGWGILLAAVATICFGGVNLYQDTLPSLSSIDVTTEPTPLLKQQQERQIAAYRQAIDRGPQGLIPLWAAVTMVGIGIVGGLFGFKKIVDNA